MRKTMAILLTVAVISVLFAGCGGSSTGYGDISTFPPVSTQEQLTDQSVNPAYEEIFTSRSIVEMPPFFMMMESAAFATVSSDGMIEKLEYGYQDDVVKEMINTLYYPISDMTEEQKTQLDAAVKETLADYTSLSFCNDTYDMGNLYYIVKLQFTDLGSGANVQKLQELGLVTGDDNSGLISMTETESSLLASGFIKR